MATLNKVFLIGNLTRDPELRYIPSGSAVATFTIGVNRVWKTPAGEKKEQASFIRIVVWGRRAEVCGEYLTKGSPVFVEGRIQSRDWQTQDGQKRNTVEVIADNIQFLRGGAAGARPGAQAAGRAPAAEEIGTIDLNEEIGMPAQAPEEAAEKPGSDSSGEVPF
jgi:single-strand DNA-binding protein